MPTDLPTADADLLASLVRGERRALARAITLAESTRADHRRRAAALLAAAPAGDALRVGLSGAPGVGKSTLVEALGLRLADGGRRVAVLAVDPSSARGGGSILGDKTRMDGLSRHPAAFIRPSPAGTTLGGVARRTAEAIRLVEAAGHDVVLVETVGVGQSETMVAAMTDVFVLLLSPGGGDELQGVKRGIMELADLVLVTKADGDLLPAARRAGADAAAALHLMRARPHDPPGIPAAMTVSAQDGDGIGDAWHRIEALADWRRRHGHRDAIRAAQARHWLHETVREGLRDRLARDPAAKAAMHAAERDVAAGSAPAAAAEDVLRAVFGETPDAGGDTT